MRRLVLSALAAALLAPAFPAAARDLGVRGATWPVAEPDLLAQIGARLADMERSGERARLGDEARERARRALEEPEPVPGIVPATELRARRFDPAIVAAEDIPGPNGQTIAVAGTRVDPLRHTALTAEVLFIDGRREAEVAWALAREGPAKIVLLAGRPLDLMRRHGRAFYFDLGGRLAGRLAIRATPTVLSHDGGSVRNRSHLLLTEYPVEDPSQTETPRTEPSRMETPQTDPSRADPSRANPSQTDRIPENLPPVSLFSGEPTFAGVNPGISGCLPTHRLKERTPMLNINRITLLGHAGRDPEVRTLNNGSKVASFALATTERWKNRDGQPAGSTQWHHIVAWGAAAEAAEKQLRKGDAVLVEGRLATREYRGRDGGLRTVAEVVVAGPQGVVNVLAGRHAPGGEQTPGGQATPGGNTTPAGSEGTCA